MSEDEGFSSRVEVWETSRNPLGEGQIIGYIPLTEVFTDKEKEDIAKGINDPKLIKFLSRYIPKEQLKKLQDNIGSNLRNTKTPVIQLDNGEIVYGCQVYWRPTREGMVI